MKTFEMPKIEVIKFQVENILNESSGSGLDLPNMTPIG